MKKARETKKRGRSVHTQVKRYRATMLGISVVVGVLLIILCVQGFALKQQIVDKDIRKDELTSQIEEETNRTSDIESLEEYMQSDEYAEAAARDKMGLLKDNEILFKTQN